MGAGSTWYFREAIFGWLLVPARGQLSPYGGLPVFTSPTEMLGATIHLAMMGGLVAAFPVLVWSAFRLVSPLLNKKQRRFAILFLPAILACFLGGTAFAYFVLLPTGLNFLLHFGTNVAVPVIKITEYMSLVTAMLFWLGVVFELPLAMYLLAKLKIVSHARFKKFRRYVPAAAFILSAIITPTFDIVNQSMVAIPLIVLFEVGLFLSGNGMNPLRWPLIRNVYSFAAGLIAAFLLAEVVGLIVVAWHVAVLAKEGRVTRFEQDSLRLRVEERIIGPYLQLLRKLGVAVEA